MKKYSKNALEIGSASLDSKHFWHRKTTKSNFRDSRVIKTGSVCGIRALPLVVFLPTILVNYTIDTVYECVGFCYIRIKQKK